jgi:hypothetical protein
MRKSLAGLDRRLRPYAELLLSFARSLGATVRITSVRRTRAKQAQLYARYLRGLSPFPAAPPGQSLHEHGLAWDMVTEPYGALFELGKIWRSWGGTWSERDPIHFGA